MLAIDAVPGGAATVFAGTAGIAPGWLEKASGLGASRKCGDFLFENKIINIFGVRVVLGHCPALALRAGGIPRPWFVCAFPAHRLGR